MDPDVSPETIRHKKDGEKKVLEAKSALEGSFFMKLISSSRERTVQAIDLYKSALVELKLAKDWRRCSEILTECAELSLTVGDKRAAANFVVESAEFQLRAKEVDSAMKTYQKAVEILKDLGNFDRAAEILRKIGEHEEKEGDDEQAAVWFSASADLFEQSKHRTSDTWKLRRKVAEIYSLEFDFPLKLKSAIEIYESLGESYLSVDLLKFQAQKFFFQAVLLFLMLDDSVGAFRAIERYSEIDPIFSTSKETEFLKKLVDFYEKGDRKGFGSVVVAMQGRRDLEKVTIQMLGFINHSLGKTNEAGVEGCPL